MADDLAASVREPAAAEIILDISRLLSRSLHPFPTGVDRVEMAYAEQLLEIAPDRLSFAAVHPTGVYGRIPTRTARAFLEQTARRWRGQGEAETRIDTLLTGWRNLLTLRPRVMAGRKPPTGQRAYLQVSPHHLDKPGLVKRILAQERASFFCLIHDLIPIQYPEYARPDGATKHCRRIDTALGYSRGVIVNSEATRQALLAHDRRRMGGTPVRVAHLATSIPRHEPPAEAPDQRPYFVMLGTIEPRKNHLLLLNLWRRFCEQDPAGTPRLVLIGRRGWENENVLDLLDRCTRLSAVEEHNALSDLQTRAFVRGARALLLPSFAEGYGLPVVEALQLGVPVLCSDLPALREAGGPVPEYMDPLDGRAWAEAIAAYATAGSPRRAEQLARRAHWRAPTWTAHVEAALDLIEMAFTQAPPSRFIASGLAHEL